MRNCASFAGLDCRNERDWNLEEFTDFTCHLNIDIQNETSYSCTACLNQSELSWGENSNFTNCSSSFKLNLATVVFESALKVLWLRLPGWPPDFCDYFSWESLISCYSDSIYIVNRTLYLEENVLDVDFFKSNDSVFENFRCFWGTNDTSSVDSYKAEYDWSFLFVILFIVAGGVGNILVCLAVCLDKRLQNVTNYFLLSLAIADLLVSLFVMPMGAIPGFLGKTYFIPNYYTSSGTTTGVVTILFNRVGYESTYL